jgi:bifunctional non-homologous end joining protein LigD
MALPRIQPIRPTWRRDSFDDPDWLFDTKYDGFRALFYLERPGRSRLISRNGNLFDRFGILADRLATVIDVETMP